MFTVKFYVGDTNPTLKGHGFDGLVIGENREEAEAFVSWINACIIAALESPHSYDAARIADLEAEVASLKSGITQPKTPMEGGFSLYKFMPGVTPEDAAAMGEALDAADHDIADAERVITWARDPNRKPASLAFTAGPERQAAYWIEWAEAAALRAALGKAEEAFGFLGEVRFFCTYCCGVRAAVNLNFASGATCAECGYCMVRIDPKPEHVAALAAIREVANG